MLLLNLYEILNHPTILGQTWALVSSGIFPPSVVIFKDDLDNTAKTRQGQICDRVCDHVAAPEGLPSYQRIAIV